MDERRLGVFLAAVNEGSFTRAALLMHLTQPGVSQLIASLEHELGATLFERTRPTLHLTDAGQALYVYAKQLMELFAATRREVGGLSLEVQGSLRLAASLTIGEHVLATALARFATRHPGVRVSLTLANSKGVAHALLRGQAELGFVEGSAAPNGLHLLPFGTDELLVIAAAQHPFARLEQIALSELTSQPLVLRERGSGTREVFMKYLHQLGVAESDLRVVLELPASEAIKAAVEAGAGVGVISEHAVRREQRLGTLVARPLRELRMRRPLSAAYARGHLLPAAARALLSELGVAQSLIAP